MTCPNCGDPMSDMGDHTVYCHTCGHYEVDPEWVEWTD
jgi:uncharacterized Zn finger protein (UPF0148 family)